MGFTCAFPPLLAEKMSRHLYRFNRDDCLGLSSSTWMDAQGSEATVQPSKFRVGKAAGPVYFSSESVWHRKHHAVENWHGLAPMAAQCGACRSRVAQLIGGALAEPPAQPAVVDVPKVGHHGGSLRMLVSNAQDTRLLVVYGYARLVGYDPSSTSSRTSSRRSRSRTAGSSRCGCATGTLSDGAPFTSEDFRYYWEDVASNEKLSPFGPPASCGSTASCPQVEILDQLTVRYSWSKPNPFFLPALAGARPMFIYVPAHYLKQFHERYADPDELASPDRGGPGARLGAAARPA